MTNPPIKTGAKTLLSLVLVVGVRGVDGVVGVLPRVSETSPRMPLTPPIIEAPPPLTESRSLLSSGIFWVDAKIADIDGSGWGMCRLSSERGLMPGVLSL